ncbi:Uncharacterised protein [[Actinobacillus] rossii]|uniref:Uncharacterized protein n=1 Tax=[Actinobacillus] rossii TaxID=123820 RepID=A0A380TPS3_9PAST|nr:Uncharacterised protein [[Actinobacillus] rossii]
MKKIIYLLLMIILCLVFAILFIQNFMAKDACLDNGGSYNEQSKICEK